MPLMVFWRRFALPTRRNGFQIALPRKRWPYLERLDIQIHPYKRQCSVLVSCDPCDAKGREQRAKVTVNIKVRHFIRLRCMCVCICVGRSQSCL